MKKKLLIIGTLILSVVPAYPQDQNLINTTTSDSITKRPQNNIFVGLLTDATVISINYERFISVVSFAHISAGAGLGYSKEIFIINNPFGGESPPPEKFFHIPHHLTANLGKKSVFLELGIGGTFIRGNREEQYVIFPIGGLRIQPPNSKSFMLRLTAAYPIDGNCLLIWPLSLSLGITF